ncbi:MAG: gfo/Idh/MocA family oxidoreductase [Thermoprotei archaeon]|nr:MAG: gfo/Idh/MocA family oxidoreductase [Thermoprotei archaeon]
MLKVAVFGVGSWGVNHVRVLRSLYGSLVKDIIVVDINIDRGKYVSKIYGAKFYSSIEEALTVERDIDAAIISTPTPLHYEHAIAALNNGIHVLIEKPMTDTIDKALKVYDEAKSLGLIIAVGFIMRYHPLVDYVTNNIIRNNVLGKIITVNSKRTSLWPNRPWDVGVVKDLAIHDIDLLHYIFREKARQVYANIGSLRHSYYEDYAAMLINYETYSAIFEANWITPYKIRYLSLTGENAVVNVDFVRNELTILREDGILKPKITMQEPLLLEDKDFLEAIISKKEPRATGVDGIRALAVCEAIIRSAKEGKIVEVEYPV